MEALKRIQANTVEKRLLTPKGTPNFNVNFYMVNARGDYAGVTMYSADKQQFAVCDDRGPRLELSEPLLEGSPD